jgi:hypothetical protein
MQQLQGQFVSATVDPASVAAGAAANTDVTVSAARTGDFVIARPPVALAAGLIVTSADVVTDGTIRVRVYNPTAGAIDIASGQWSFLLIKEG